MTDIAYIPSSEPLLLKILINDLDNGLHTFLKTSEVKFELNKIPSATIEIIQPNPETNTNDFEAVAKYKVNDKIELQANNKTIFKGIIISANSQLSNSGNNTITLECKDAIHKLSQNASEATYEISFSDALDQIFASHTDFTKNINTGTFGNETVLRTTNTTDWDYMIGFLDSVGQTAVVRNSEITTIDINKKNETSSYLAQNGVNVFNLSGDQNHSKEITKVTITRHLEGQNEPEKIEYENPNSEAVKNELPEIKLSECRYSTETLKRIAQSIIGRSIHCVTRGTVETFGNLEAQLGQFISFKKVNPQLEEQSHLISIEKHKIENGSWKTEYTFGLENSQNFSQNVATQTSANSSEARIGVSNSIKGLHIGVVTNLEDPEGKFRIQIRIPAISQNGDGIWARMSSIQAGKERGVFFIPEVGDEVIVGFFNDDMNNPVILGKLFNTENEPPFTITNENYLQGIVSKEKTTFLIDDEKKELKLSTQSGNSLLISEDKKGLILEDQNGNKITMDDNGITIESTKDINIKATGNLNIEGVQNSIKASGMMELKGSMIKLN